ncbi:MAG TPA: zf-TFIIB domain-containing protein [Minicystis sp.]|nr:zf-TFIIB domain-containing protein [Minicystis sp.]
MTSTYRAASARCPGCAGVMEAEDAGGAEIDRCPDCGGVWFDWFDGELGELAGRARASDAGAPPGGAHEATGAPSCPRCGRGLEEARYHAGPVILRCGECAGAFVDRSSLAGLAATVDDDAEATPASPLARFLAVLRRMFGAPSPAPE